MGQIGTKYDNPVTCWDRCIVHFVSEPIYTNKSQMCTISCQNHTLWAKIFQSCQCIHTCMIYHLIEWERGVKCVILLQNATTCLCSRPRIHTALCRRWQPQAPPSTSPLVNGTGWRHCLPEMTSQLWRDLIRGIIPRICQPKIVQFEVFSDSLLHSQTIHTARRCRSEAHRSPRTVASRSVGRHPWWEGVMEWPRYETEEIKWRHNS